MKNKQIPHSRNKSKIKIIEKGKIIHLTHKYMIVHFHGLVQTLQ